MLCNIVCHILLSEWQIFLHLQSHKFSIQGREPREFLCIFVSYADLICNCLPSMRGHLWYYEIASFKICLWLSPSVIVVRESFIPGSFSWILFHLVRITRRKMLWPKFHCPIFCSLSHCYFLLTSATGLVQGWAAITMGILSGSIPWFTMMIIHKRWTLLQKVDDTLGVFHTHAVAGFLGGATTGLFAEPELCALFLPVTNSRGAIYRGVGGVQFLKQLAGAAFIIGWNIVVTSIICLVIKTVIPLRMSEEQLTIGDDAVHGEEAYALWGDGEKYDSSKHGWYSDDTHHSKVATGVTQNV